MIVHQQNVTMLASDDSSVQETTWWYDLDDPYAVHVLFYDDQPEYVAHWMFARDLLTVGLDSPTGIGDVQVWPHRGRIALRLSPPGEERTYLARRRDLSYFVLRSELLVPSGTERVPSFDVELSRLLAGEVL